MRALKTREQIQAERQARIALKTAQVRARGVKKVGKGAKYPHLVNEPLRAFVRQMDCILKGLTDGDGKAHQCWAPVACCHLKTTGSGGADENNVWPGCVRAHAEQEGRTQAFEARWGVKLAATYGHDLFSSAPR